VPALQQRSRFVLSVCFASSSPSLSLPLGLAITRRSSRSVVAYVPPLRYVCLAPRVRTVHQRAAKRRRIYPVLNTRRTRALASCFRTQEIVCLCAGPRNVPTVPHIDPRSRKPANRKRSVTRPTASHDGDMSLHFTAPPLPAQISPAPSRCYKQPPPRIQRIPHPLVSMLASLTPIPTQRHTHHGTCSLLLPLFSLPLGLIIMRRSSRSIIGYVPPYVTSV
jgi:hypothetical protein